MNSTSVTTTRQIRCWIREPYSWPGFYPITAIHRDGSLTCAECARAEYRSISYDFRHDSYDRIETLGIIWEGHQTCELCGVDCTAYGPYQHPTTPALP